MSPSSAAVYNSLFLKAERRTITETAGSRTYRTRVAQHACLDDIFILPGASLQPDLTHLGGELLLLPIVGGALLTTAHEVERPVIPGFIYSISVAEAGPITLTNPFEQETVNVLLIQVPVSAAAGSALQEFELLLNAKNVLVAPVNSALPVQVGLYDSRVKDQITASNPASTSLCYVLNGSFEIEDRLAEHRDALLLWELPELQFEALSETAMLLHLQLDPRLA